MKLLNSSPFILKPLGWTRLKRRFVYSLGHYLDRTIKDSQILGQKTIFISILMIISSTIIYLYLDNSSGKIDAEKDTLEIEIILHYLLINLKISYVFFIET